MNPLAPIIAVVVSLLLVWLARTTDSSALFQLLLAVSSVFLVLLVLVQKGRGGGLAGALGGPGGSSAFGAKAGDIFTRITIVAAIVWVIFAIGAALWAKNNQDNALGSGGGQLKKAPASAPSGSPSDAETPATGTTGTESPATGPTFPAPAGGSTPSENPTEVPADDPPTSPEDPQP